MNNQQRNHGFWEILEKVKTVGELLAAILVIAPVALALYTIVQQGLSAPIPAWVVVAASTLGILSGFLLGRGSSPLARIHSRAWKIIYDIDRDYDPPDFQGKEGQFWSSVEGKPAGPRGLGQLTVNGRVLSIRRTNKEGRYEVWLRRYVYDGKRGSYIPRNELISGKRKLRISCQAKITEGEHILRFVLKDESGKLNLPNKTVTVNLMEWTPIELAFELTPAVDCWLRIDSEKPSRIPSSVQIRNLTMAEWVP